MHIRNQNTIVFHFDFTIHGRGVGLVVCRTVKALSCKWRKWSTTLCNQKLALYGHTIGTIYWIMVCSNHLSFFYKFYRMNTPIIHCAILTTTWDLIEVRIKIEIKVRINAIYGVDALCYHTFTIEISLVNHGRDFGFVNTDFNTCCADFIHDVIKLIFLVRSQRGWE